MMNEDLYIILGGEEYYASGPSNFLGFFTDKEKAIKEAERIFGMFDLHGISNDMPSSPFYGYPQGNHIEWCHVMDARTGKVVHVVAKEYPYKYSEKPKKVQLISKEDFEELINGDKQTVERLKKGLACRDSEKQKPNKQP